MLYYIKNKYQCKNKNSFAIYKTDKFIFVCSKKILSKSEYREILKNITPNYAIVEIDSHELGPIYSVLQAEAQIEDKNLPIIISYCDFTMEWNYKQFLLQSAHYNGAMAVFKGFQPASFGDTYYAYVQENENNEMIELREKKSFTEKRHEEFASTGIYFIESWNIFSHYANKITKEKPQDLKEYYVSLIYNPMVKDGLKISLFEVKKFICWGTPQDLEEYFFWSDYFKQINTGASND